MLYGVKVWRLSRPYHNLKFMVNKPLLGSPTGVLGVIVLLKDNVIWSFAIILQGLLEFILQNLQIQVSIHPTINLASHSNPFQSHTTPHHQASSTKLYCPLHQPITQALSCLFPCPPLAIWPNVVNFRLIWPYDPLPVLHSPVLMAQSKVHSCSSMACSEKRALFLHHSLHSCFLQVMTDGLGWDGLVLDILKGSGELDSILSLSSSNQPDDMKHVSGSNDGRVTTRGFGKVRMEFGANSTDSRVVYTSSKRNLASRLTQIQERDDLIGLSMERNFMVVEVVKVTMFVCFYIMLNYLCITWPIADIINHCNTWFSYFNRSATKLLQWHGRCTVDISPQPLDQIT